MSPIRHLTPSPSTLAPGAWSPFAMEVLRDMLDNADACNAESNIALPILTAPLPTSADHAWDLSSFFTPVDAASDMCWEAAPALTRSASPASSDSPSFTSMSMDELTSLLNDQSMQAERKRRVNSLADMDEDTASAFLFHIAQQLESVPQADTPSSPAVSNDDADAELQYHLRTLKPNPTLASAPEPLVDDSMAIGTDELPPRPPNAFILYRRHQQAHLRSERPGIHLHLASKLIATWWKNESPATKEYYRTLASDGRKELLKRFPDYKYRARTEQERAQVKRKKKERKSSADVAISPEHALYLQALSPYLCQ